VVNAALKLDNKIVKRAVLGVSVILFILFMFSMKSVFQNIGASEIVVIQSPVKGTLNVYKTEGVKLQGYGHVTIYQKASQIDCVFEDDQGRTKDSYEPLDIRFNDAGKAKMGTSVRWEMPMEDEKVIALHRKYGSQEAIERDLVMRTLERSSYNTGPLYSSRESYAEKRADLLSSVEDQARFGVYKTKVRSEKRIDPLTNEEKTVDIVELIPNPNAPGGYERQTKSPLDEFGIQLVPGTLTINRVEYDESVQAQIDAQQDAIMKVQTAIAKAKEAEQNAITVAEQGKATAAGQKWEQEAIKAKNVTMAESARDVAALKKQEAEFYKAEQVLRGEGDAERKRLAMQADGALEQKLAAYTNVMRAWAENAPKYTGAWVPSVVMGDQPGGTANGAQTMMELLSVKAARDLGLDLSIPSKK